MKFCKIAMVAVGVTLAAGQLSVPALADGDATRGKKMFNKCKACHKLAAGKKAIGPTLHGLFGRTAGTLAKFKYSKDMKAAGEKGLVWDEKTFVTYIATPKKYIGGLVGKKKAKTKMVFRGLKKEKDRADLLAYLKQATK